MRTFEELANPWVAGLGVYEPGRPIEEVARDMGFASVNDIIKLASNENALGPSPLAVKAMRAAASRMHLYPDGGSFYLRQALGKAIDVPPECLLPGCGSNELIELLGHAFLRPGRHIVMADRAFVVYRLVAMAAQAGVIAVPMRDFTHDLDAMAAAVTPETALVFIGNPNNPTGTMVDAAAIDRFMQRVPDSVVVCFDEAYIELLPRERQPDTLRYVREGRNAVILRTFSKTYGLAGLRIGYAAAPARCIQLLNRVRQPFNVTAMALEAAVAALADTRHVERTCRMVERGLKFFAREFRRLKLPYVPSVANFVLVKTGAGRDVFEKLQREGVIIRPMDGYGLPEYVRVTVGTPAENRRFIAALTKVLAG